MPKLVYMTAIGLLLVSGAFLLTERFVCPPGPTEANVQRIWPGMAYSRAKAILGGENPSAIADRGSHHGCAWLGEGGYASLWVEWPSGRVEWATWTRKRGPVSCWELTAFPR